MIGIARENVAPEPALSEVEGSRRLSRGRPARAAGGSHPRQVLPRNSRS